jgi:hypothetical protein
MVGKNSVNIIRLLTIAISLSHAVATFSQQNLVLGDSVTETLTSGACRIFNITLVESDSFTYDDDETPDGVSDGRLKNAELELSFTINSGTLQYFALLVPFAEGSGKPMNNEPSMVLTHDTCWPTAAAVNSSGHYTNSSYGAGPLVQDMTSKTSATYKFNQQDCKLYLGTYYIVVVSDSTASFSVTAELNKVNCINIALAVVLIVVYVILCCGCCVVLPITICICCLKQVTTSNNNNYNNNNNNQSVAMVAMPQQGMVVQQGYVQPQQGTVVQQGYVQPQQGMVVQQGYVQPQQGMVVQQGFVQPSQGVVVQQGYVQPQQGVVVQQGYVQPNQAGVNYSSSDYSHSYVADTGSNF